MSQTVICNETKAKAMLDMIPVIGECSLNAIESTGTRVSLVLPQFCFRSRYIVYCKDGPYELFLRTKFYLIESHGVKVIMMV